jgi:hypothetical protein
VGLRPVVFTRCAAGCTSVIFRGGLPVDRPSWAPVEVDPTRPSVARVYDFYLGGSHNFDSDRRFGLHALRAMPRLPTILRDAREFLRRVVVYLSGLGIEQFLDLGSGIPTVGNVHEVAQSVNPRARVVYVDNDAVAIAHSRALLEGNTLAAAVQADLREPEAVLGAAAATGLVDLGRPVGVLLLSVLHFIPDEDRPGALVARYMTATASGSYLALSSARGDGRPETGAIEEVYDRRESPMRMRMRSWAEIEALFGDLTMVDPGLVLVPLWHPELADDLEPAVPTPSDYPGVAGLGRRE